MYDTIFPADCLQFNKTTREILIGTYYLDEASKTKSGTVILLAPDCQTSKTIKTNAVLDLSWISQTDFITADSKGLVNNYSNFQLVSSLKISDSLLTSLSTFNNVTSVSRTDGSVSLIDLNTGSFSDLKVSDLEVWTIHLNDSVLYTGSDDSELKLFDTRSNMLASRTRLDMGVTSIKTNPVTGMIAVGCYDEHLRIYDPRNIKKPLLEEHIGNGGLWKLEWNEDGERIAAACMHDGFRVLKVKEKIEILAEYKEHESLAYGVDWADENVACCSFYDCKFSIWKP